MISIFLADGVGLAKKKIKKRGRIFDPHPFS
jgi:hypothetical protein